MNNYGWARPVAFAAVCLAAVVGAAPQAKAEIAELKAKKIALSIDRKDVSVSGISSGAAMAHQLHIARSADLVGVGMVAGPPYRCADYLKGNPAYPVTSEITAVGLCTAYYEKLGMPLGAIAALPIETSRLMELAKDAFDRKKVDAQANLCGDRVYLISGGKDDTVPAKVSDATKALYGELMAGCPAGQKADTNLKAVTVDGMPHTMPTDSRPNGRNCFAGAPYIADCDVPGAQDILSFLHPAKAAAPQANRPADPANLIAFSQKDVIGATNPQGLMHKTGYVYVPEACKTGAACSLHIALHGCHQNEDMINKESKDPSRTYLFARDAGYNDFAERNNIVVLYPQAAATGMTGGNPNGCWDWWGYNGTDYWQKDARQIRNIWKIVEALSKK